MSDTINVNPTPTASDGPTVCAVHPTVETMLKCNKCGRYMCIKCAVKVPVGYRCRECVYQHQNLYYNVLNRDYLIAGAVSFAAILPIAYLINQVGFGLFLTLIFALPIGGFLGQIVHRAIGRRRGRYTWVAAVVGIVVGTLIVSLVQLQPLFMILQASQAIAAESGDVVGIVLQQLFSPMFFAALCAFGAAARLRYGK